MACLGPAAEADVPLEDVSRDAPQAMQNRASAGAAVPHDRPTNSASRRRGGRGACFVGGCSRMSALRMATNLITLVRLPVKPLHHSRVNSGLRLDILSQTRFCARRAGVLRPTRASSRAPD